MSDKSSNNDNNDNNENNTDLALNGCQQQNDCQNTNNNTDYSYPSFLSTNCSVPTELFNTLSPISLSQITSQSTPFITTNRNDFRREPMGAEYVDNSNALLRTVSVETHLESGQLIDEDIETQFSPQTIAKDRPPLIGQSDTALPSIGFKVTKKVEPIEEVSDDEDRDALAAKVEQLLGRTKRELTDEDFDVESLGLIRVIRDKHSNETNETFETFETIDNNDSSDQTTNDLLIEAERSEPDGKGKPYQGIQQNVQMSADVKKLVHYSSSESEDEEEENEVKENVMPSSSDSSQENVPNLRDTVVRYRSYSASGSSGIKHSGLQTNVGFGVTFSREKDPLKPLNQIDSAAAGTQTLRSFLAEQALQQNNENSSSDNSSSTASQTTPKSIPFIPTNRNDFTREPLDGEYVDNRIKALKAYTASTGTQVMQSGLQTNIDFGISLTREKTQSKQISQKDTTAAATQTLRSFLTEKTLKPKDSSGSDNSSPTVSQSNSESPPIISTKNEFRRQPMVGQYVDSRINVCKNCLSRGTTRIVESVQKTNIGFGISSLVREKIERKQVSNKDTTATGTQTLRSFLAKQAIKQALKRALKQRIEESSSDNTSTTVSSALELKKRLTPIDTKPKRDATNALQSKRLVVTNNRKEEFEILDNVQKQSISWFIPINKSNKNNSLRISKKMTQYSGSRNRQLSKEHTKHTSTSTPLTLQEAFNRNCKSIRIQSQMRINRINKCAEMRRRTAEERLIGITKSYETHQQNAKLMKTYFVDQPIYNTTIKRVFTHKEMRAQTEKIYMNLPEVLALKEKKKKEEKEKNQRLMAQIYKYRLKDNALKGKVTWKITQSCLSY